MDSSEDSLDDSEVALAESKMPSKDWKKFKAAGVEPIKLLLSSLLSLLVTLSSGESALSVVNPSASARALSSAESYALIYSDSLVLQSEVMSDSIS